MRKPAALKLSPVEPLDKPNPLVVVGGNHPPEPIAEEPAEPTPYEKAKARIDDLVGELRLSADGAKVETQELCDYFANIEAMLRKAVAEAKAAMADEKSELSKQVQAIQDRYNLLIGENKTVTGSAILAIATAKKIQEPFLVAKAAAIEAEAKRLRDEAEAKRLAAEAALRASSPENLVEREEAEQLVTEARIANAVANKAENTTAKAGGTFGRSTGLHTFYDGVIHDQKALGGFLWMNHREAYTAFLQGQVDALLRTGSHTVDDPEKPESYGVEIPGVRITSRQGIR